MQTPTLPSVRRSRLVERFPLYYGWLILGIGSVGIILTAPGQTYAVSVFIDYFIDDLGISRGLISSLYTIGTLTASLAMPWVGNQIDRRGSRLMMVLISLFFGIACFYMSTVRTALMLGLGFLFLRMLGQGSLSLVSKNAINQWWVRRRGMAMGIAGMAAAVLSSGGFPTLINSLIPLFGWRTTYVILGLMIWAIVLPLSLIFVRNRPEEYGLVPDGIAVVDRESGGDHPPLEINWTRDEAVRTSVFWLVAAGLSVQSALSTGLTFHIFSIFRDSGLSAAVTASVFVPMALTAAIVQIAGGILIDRVPVRVLLALSLLLMAFVLVMAPHLNSIPLAYAYGLLSGVRGGLQLIVSNVVWAKYFGRRHLGSITGIVATLSVGSSALGPMPFGIARDLAGSYEGVLTGFALLPLVLALVTVLFVRPPAVKEA